MSCAVLMGVLTIMFLAVGAVAGATAVPAVQQTMCSVDNFFRNTTDFLAGVETRVANLSSLATQASVSATSLETDLTCLSSTFTTGSVVTACTAITAANGAAASVELRVTDASGGSSASSLSADWASLVSQLAGTRTLLCTTLLSYAPTVSSARSGVNELSSPLSDAVSGLQSVADSLSDQTRDFRHKHLDYLKGQRDAWSGINDGGNWSGAGLFIPHMVLLVLGFLGVLCMLRPPQEKRCTANSVGVQTSGCGWVLFTCFGPFLFLLGALGVFGTLLMSDSGHLIIEVPKDPHTQLGPVICSQRTLSFGGGSSVSACTLFEGCFADAPVSLWAAISPSLTFNLVDIGTQLTGAIEDSGLAAGSPFDVAELLQGANQSAALANSISGLSASTFGIPFSHSQHDPINVNLAAMVANLTAASAAITGSNDLACATRVADAIPGLLTLAYAVLAESSTEAMDATFACGFFRANLDDVVQPSLTGSVRDATGALSVCLVLSSVCAVCLVALLIALQIIYGDVGIEPGCPSCLRCCCCYTPGANVSAGRLGLARSVPHTHVVIRHSPGHGAHEGEVKGDTSEGSVRGVTMLHV